MDSSRPSGDGLNGQERSSILQLPFSQSFQIREDEGIALQALFAKVFYGGDLTARAMEALERIRFAPRISEAVKVIPPALSSDPTRYILLNRGETGIGKTRVFRQFRHFAAERRIPVYEIHCYDVEGIPFKPFLRVIREILRDFEFGDALREKYRSALEGILPEIYGQRTASLEEIEVAGDFRPQRGRSEADMIRAFDSLTQLLFEITAIKPAVILVHDLHWGDRGTIELLRYIGRNLQLRNARIAATASRRRRSVELPQPQGPETGEDEGEWRELVSKGARGSGGEPASLDGIEDREERSVRLMILANYRGSDDGEHYLERAIRRLGDEPFTFHGEIRTLNPEETARFIQRTLEDADLPPGCPRAVCEPEAVEAIYRLCEGFPSYIHELFRLLFLSDCIQPTGQTVVIDPVLLRAVLGTDAIPPGAGATAPSAAPPRTRILVRRLEALTQDERRLLAVLALARKPLTADFLGKVLDGSECPVAGVEKILDALDERGFVERVRHEFPRGGEEAGFCFRIADYAAIAAEELSTDERRRIHQRIAEECRKVLPQEGDEEAYEIYHHLQRGIEPGSAVGFGILAARRFARSFSLEKAVQVCDRVLEILPPPPPDKAKKDPKESPGVEASGPRVRQKVLDLKADLHLRLKEHPLAEAALGLILKEGDASLSDEEKTDILIRETEVALAARDPNRAIKILSKARRLVKDDSTPRAARLQLGLARAYLDREDTKRTINFCLDGLKVCQKILDAEEYPELLRIVARAHITRGDYAIAVDNFQRAFEWYEKRERKAAAADVLDDLGRVYLDRGNYFRAARYLYRSLEFKRREGDILGLSRSYDELGRVYLRTGDEIKTIEHLNRSLSLKERVGDLEGLNPTLGILGGLYFRLGNFQRAIRYFKREVENSQFLADTRGLVEAFLHLAWVYLEVGELKQVENLSRQVTILSGEFKLRAQQAEGARLQGILDAMDRNWVGSEKLLRQAIEIHVKLGDRPHEAEALLDLAEVKFTRELFDESLKLASKGMIIAEGLKAPALQARAHVIKGNVHRFLKGGNADRAKESLRRGLELGQNLNDVRLLFDIFYSLAKVYHYDREFAEAGNFYGKAEAILRKVAEGLPEDMAARFYEDHRRKLFLEDAARFRKEVQSRTASGAAIELQERPAAMDLREMPVGLNDYKDLLPRLVKLHTAISEVDFCDRFLAEAMELLRAERGMVLQVQSRQYRVEASAGFAARSDDDGEFLLVRSLAEDSVRKGRSILVSGAEDDEKTGKTPRLAVPGRRAVLAVPIATAERVFGGLYIDRSISLGRFSSRDLVMAEAFAAHGGCAFENRRRYDGAIREPSLGLYAPAYFLEKLKDAFRWHNLHGRKFHLLGFHLPALEGAIGSTGGFGPKLTADLEEVLQGATAASSWWNPVLAVLVFDVDLAAAQAFQARIAEKLSVLLKDDIEIALLEPEGQFSDGGAMYQELRRKLLPEECDLQTLTELRRLLARDIPLKEAKKILEKHIIESTLRKTGGNITHAAKELGIHRPQLSNLLKKHALKRELYEREEFDIRMNPMDN